MAATLATEQISETISNGQPGILAHGPTYMANPLACRAAIANIDVLLASPWQDNIKRVNTHLTASLSELKALPGVADVRTLGAIGVVELKRTDLGPKIQSFALENGVWVRPFGKLIYTMPAYNISQNHLTTLSTGLVNAIKSALE